MRRVPAEGPPAAEARSRRTRSSSKTSLSATSVSLASARRTPAVIAPVVTSTTAARVTSAASTGSASTSYSRSSSIVRSARPADSATNSVVSPASRALRSSATHWSTRPWCRVTLWQAMARTGRSASSTASRSSRVAVASDGGELVPGHRDRLGREDAPAPPRRLGVAARQRRVERLAVLDHVGVLDHEQARAGLVRVVEDGAAAIDHLDADVVGALRRAPARLGQHVAQRQQQDVVDRLDRPLRLRVVAAQRLDGVAEELDADRLRLAGREDVDQAAADAEFAVLIDGIGAGEAGVDEAIGERRQIDVDVGLQHHGGVAHPLDAADAGRNRRHRGHDRRVPPSSPARAGRAPAPTSRRGAARSRDTDRSRATGRGARRARRGRRSSPRASRRRSGCRRSADRCRDRPARRRAPATGAPRPTGRAPPRAA